MPDIRWNERQREAIEARGTDLLVSAAAGSGKTAVLTARVLSLLREGTPPEALLIVTYTQAAAAQLRARIARTLEDDPEPRIAALSQTLGRAQISTVHAFCTTILREFFMQADVDPLFRVLDAPKAQRLADQAQAQALDEAILQGGEAVCDLYARFGGPEKAAALARNLYETSRAQPDSAAWRAGMLHDFEKNAETPEKSAWAMRLTAQMRAAFNRAAALASQAAACCPDEKLAGALENQAAQMHARAQMQDYLLLSAPFDFVRLNFARGTDPADKTAVSAAYDQAKKEISAAIAVPRGQALALDAQMLPALRALGDLCDRFERCYEALKRETLGLDFSDLEHHALAALRDSGVQKALRARFEYVFVDEYQDANALQEAILSAVSRENNRFMVGDVKQSIYSFRMAEPSLFVEKYRAFLQGEGGRRIDLNENYRSARQVLAFANHVFSAAMSPRVGGVAYDDAAALRPGRALEGLPTRIVLADMAAAPAAQDGEDQALLAEMSAAKAEAALIAQQVRRLLGTPIPDGDGQRPAGYEDICILMRSPKTWGSAVTDALSAQGIPATGEADGAYYDLCEVRTFLNLLFVIDNRRRDVPLIGALTAPYAGFTPSELMHVRAAFPQKELSFFDACARYARQAGDSIAQRLGDFLEKLLLWRSAARSARTGDFVRDVLDESGYLAYAGTLPLGRLRAENLRALAARADGYDTLGDFLAVAALGDAGSGESGVAPLPDHAQAVRILSIHRAKGLEFPLVILAGAGKKLNARDSAGDFLTHRRVGFGVRYCDPQYLVTMDTLSRLAVADAIDEDRVSEEMRVLYVALTRPIVQLVITATVRDFEKRALRALDFAKNNRYRDAGDYLDFLLPPLCAHPDGGALRRFAPCAVETGAYPCALELQCVPADAAVLESPSDPPDVPWTPQSDQLDDLWVEKRLSWQYVPPRDALPRKLAVTRLARTEQDALLPMPDFARDTAAGAPAAARGTALHALFAAVDPAALRDLDDAGRLACIEAAYDRLRQNGVIGQTSRIRPQMAAAFYQTPLGRQAMASPLVRREQPFNLTVPAADVGQEEGRVMLQGVIDLYYQNEQDGYTIVDFKTGRLSEQKACETYGAQVGVYAAALERITGRRVQGYLYLADMGLTVRVV